MKDIANINLRFLRIKEQRSEKGLNGDSNPDFFDAGAVLYYHLSYQANWVRVILWINDEPVDHDGCGCQSL